MTPETRATVLAQLDAGPDHTWAALALLDSAHKRGEPGAAFIASAIRAGRISAAREQLGQPMEANADA